MNEKINIIITNKYLYVIHYIHFYYNTDEVNTSREPSRSFIAAFISDYSAMYYS